MTDIAAQVAANVAAVRSRIAAAARRAGRTPADIRLVGVTKYVDLPTVRALLAAGVPDLGESRVQQLTARAAELGTAAPGWPDSAEAPGPRWHMIGHLQRNKVRQLLPHARIVHSLDSDRLTDALQQHAADLDLTADVFLEVNVAGEASKDGIGPAAAAALAARIQQLDRLTLRGLMTMAPFDADPETARPVFARLRELLERLRTAGAVGPQCVELSMGMSHDYVVAVEEGATVVRVGSALFTGLPSTDPREAG